MRRWNGWGDEGQTYPLPDIAAGYLAEQIGPAQQLCDAALTSVVAGVPAARHAPHPLISDDPLARLRHARGQSLPDWIDLRSGQIETFPDAVACPQSEAQVKALLEYAAQNAVRLIPYGGGTSVVGHINPESGSDPVVSVDMRRMAGLLELDKESRLATFAAGVSGPELESQLQQNGLTLGHYPQSFEYSTLGGWIATRSSGQQSYYYGRIEELFAGGRLLTPVGTVDLPAFPASAAGPDLRHMVLGSEGRFGIISRATVRVRPLPEREGFFACFFHDWESGAVAVREIAQAGLPASMLRLSDARETETTLVLSGQDRLLPWADRGLRILGYGPDRCLLIYGLTGARREHGRLRRRLASMMRTHGGLPVGGMIGRQWRKSRFRSPYLRNTLWEEGYAIDTLETAIRWSDVLPTADRVKGVLRDGLANDVERVLVFCHLSHVYADGASIYFTYLFRRAADPEQTRDRWRRLKQAASQVIVDQGGTISHQHGVGVDHAGYLVAEKGENGLRALEALRRSLDPTSLMNPGKLLNGHSIDKIELTDEDKRDVESRLA
jgi:alkyldihydroxyacetonephosphate synthase